ncbi:MAG: glycosyltransferase, partial [Bacteroidota bacterium]
PEEREQQEQALAEYLRHHAVEVVLAQYGPAGVVALPVCRELGIPLVVHFHGYDAFRQDVLSTHGRHYRELFAYADRILAVSIPMMEQLHALGCPTDKLEQVRIGIDTESFYPGTLPSTPRLVACGRFVPKKGPELLLEAFRLIREEHPETTLDWIGDGPLWEQTQERARALKLDHAIRFHGVLAPEDVAAVLRSCRVLLQPSITAADGDSEGTPIVILEAMACGLPVVATRHAGIPEVVEHGVNGLLVRPGDVRDMAASAGQLLSDLERCRQLGRHGAMQVSVTHASAAYLDHMHSILLRARSAST